MNTDAIALILIPIHKSGFGRILQNMAYMNLNLFVYLIDLILILDPGIPGILRWQTATQHQTATLRGVVVVLYFCPFIFLMLKYTNLYFLSITS